MTLKKALEIHSVPAMKLILERKTLRSSVAGYRRFDQAWFGDVALKESKSFRHWRIDQACNSVEVLACRKCCPTATRNKMKSQRRSQLVGPELEGRLFVTSPAMVNEIARPGQL